MSHSKFLIDWSKYWKCLHRILDLNWFPKYLHRYILSIQFYSFYQSLNQGLNQLWCSFEYFCLRIRNDKCFDPAFRNWVNLSIQHRYTIVWSLTNFKLITIIFSRVPNYKLHYSWFFLQSNCWNFCDSRYHQYSYWHFWSNW